MPRWNCTIGELVERLAKAQRAKMAQQENIPPDDFIQTSILIPFPTEARFFDWALDDHVSSTKIRALPYPGVLIVVGGDLTELEVVPSMYFLKDNLQALPQVQGFLSSPESRFVPEANYDFDIFLSYSSKDNQLALELRNALESKGAKVFIAEQSIPVGEAWKEEIRQAIRCAKLVVLLLTPASVNSPWVIFECGAAWVLNSPICIAVAHVQMSDMPDALATYQCRPFETQAQRDAFIAEVGERLIGFEQHTFVQ